MKAKTITFEKYEADTGKVFDWANLEAHTYEDEDGNVIQDHLYAKELFLAETDSIENYVEVEQVVQ